MPPPPEPSTLDHTEDAPPVATAPPEGAGAAAPSRKPLGVTAWLAVGWIGLVLLAALFADLLPLQSATTSDFSATAAPPSGRHLLGTDSLGRDLLARIVYGGRVSLAVGIVAVLLGMAIGSTLGLLAGYLRGRVESLTTSFADAMLAFPAIVLLLGITAVLGQSLRNLILGLAIVTVPAFIRLTRANTLQVGQQEFVQAARTTGARPARIIAREIVPNVVPPTAAYAFIIMAVVIVAEGSLSFLGLGVPPPTPSWGGMIADGRNSLATSPHIVFVPSVVLFLTVFAFNLLGDRLRERLDIREVA